MLLFAAVAVVAPSLAGAETKATLSLRGQEQTLRLYGPRTGPPVVVSSGDGGWTHLGPDVAAFLETRGFFVVGFDCKHYLSSFTSGSTTLASTDVPKDYHALVDYARGARAEPVLLVGVSEGAGLSVLAASDPGLQASLRGVLALGLPDVNELGWRFFDSAIYVTHKTPNEPTFKAADYVPRLGTVPLAAIHATHDEFVPVDEVKRLIGPARRPQEARDPRGCRPPLQRQAARVAEGHARGRRLAEEPEALSRPQEAASTAARGRGRRCRGRYGRPGRGASHPAQGPTRS